MIGRHHIGIIGKANEGRAIRHIDIEHDILEQFLAIDRRQAGAQADFVAPAMQHALDADLLLLGFDGCRRRVGDDDEGGKVGGRVGERAGEHGADARRGRFGIDHVIDHAEAVLGDDVVEMGFHRFVGRQPEAQPVGRDHLAPHLAVFHAIGQRGQRIGAIDDVGGAQERIHRCRRGELRQIVAVVSLGLPGDQFGLLQRGLRERLPDGAIIGVDGKGLPVGDDGGHLVVGGDGLLGGLHEAGIGHLGRRGIGLRQAAGEAAGGVDDALGGKRQFGLADRFGHGGRRRAADPAGGGAGKLGLLADGALEEAPVRLAIEGEGAADIVFRAGGAAGIELGVADDGVVVAGKIGVLEQRDLLIGGHRRPGSAQRQHQCQTQRTHLRDDLTHRCPPKLNGTICT